MRELVTYVKATCDLSGKEFDPTEVDPITFTWLGNEYELDVAPSELPSINEVTIARLLEVSRIVKKKRGKRSPKDPAKQKSAEVDGFLCGVDDCEVVKPTQRGINSHRRIAHGVEPVQHRIA